MSRSLKWHTTVVSKIVLGCMSYGSPEWSPWVLEEEEAIKHIKAAYVLLE